MSQGGSLVRFDLKNREQKPIKPPAPVTAKADGSRERLRFNWNAGLAQDPFEPGTIYYGSQYVHKSTHRKTASSSGACPRFPPSQEMFR